LNHPNPAVRSWDGVYVTNGMLKDFDGEPLYESFYEYTPSRHLTIVFNVFVFLQIFNMLAARKINDEINIFDGVFTNPMFCGVWLVIVIGQIVIVSVGSTAMKVHIAGLTSQQWIICICIGFLSLPMNLVLKFVSDKVAIKMGNEKDEDIRIANEDYLNLRKIAGQ